MTADVARCAIDVRLVMGRVEVYSWLEPRPDGSLVGMGRRVVYDADGVKVKDDTEPTGVVLRGAV